MKCLPLSKKRLCLLLLSSLPFTPLMGEDAGVAWPEPSTLFHIGNLNGANGLWKDAFEEAAQRWNDAPTRFNFEVSRESGSGYCSNLGENNVRFSSTKCGDAWGSSALGVTAYWSRDSQLTKADISFNTNRDWDVYDGNIQPYANDFRRVAMHEMGHAAGLAHAVASDVLMSTSANNTYLPALDDVNSLQKKYGSATHTLTIKNSGSGLVTLAPRVPGTGVISENTLHTSNYGDFLNCYAAQCQFPIQHGLRLTMSAVPAQDTVFIGWEGTTVRESRVALGAFTADRTLVANFSSIGDTESNHPDTTDSDTVNPVEQEQALASEPLVPGNTLPSSSASRNAGGIPLPMLALLLVLTRISRTTWRKTFTSPAR